jgi:hypothetical protein
MADPLQSLPEDLTIPSPHPRAFEPPLGSSSVCGLRPLGADLEAGDEDVMELAAAIGAVQPSGHKGMVYLL